MSTPPRRYNTDSTTPPPETPGWRNALFGVFSAKKSAPAPVETSTSRTQQQQQQQQNHSPHAAGRVELRFPLTSPTRQPMNATRSSTAMATTTTTTTTATTTTTDVHVGLEVATSPPAVRAAAGAFSPLATTTARQPYTASKMVSAKSPWKSPAMNGVRSRGGGMSSSLKQPPSTSTKMVAAISAKKSSSRRPRQRNYRPESSVLVKTKIKKRGGIDAGLAVRALEGSKDVFAPSTLDLQVKQNYATFKAGSRLLGAHQRGSRLPVPPPPQEQQQQQLLSDDRESQQQQQQRASSSKRQQHKKVHFTDPQGAVVAQVATPVRIMPRMSTPYKSAAVATTLHDQDEESMTESSSTTTATSPSSLMASPKKFPPLPAAPNWVLTEAPFTFSAPEDIGEPVSGVSMRIPFQFVVRPPFGVSIKSASRQCPSYNQAEYELEQEEANRIQKENQSIFNNTMDMDDTNNSNGGGGSGSERATKKTKTAADWKCHNCTKMNAEDESTCLGCNERKAVNPDAPQGWGNTFQNLNKDKWKCLDCSAYNDDTLDSCAACDTKKGEGGSSTEAPSASSAPALTSNSATSAIAPQPASSSGTISSGGFSFGAAAPPAAPSGSDIGTGGFSFGGATTATPAKTSGFSFSASNDVSSAASTPSGSGFVFNAAKPPPPSTSENGVKPKPLSVDDSKPVFSFGTTPGKEGVSKDAPKPTFAFGGAPPSGSLQPQAPAPAAEPSSKRGRSGSNGESTKSTELPEVKPFTFGATSGANGAKVVAVSFGANTKEPQPFSFGTSTPAPAAPPAAEIQPVDASKFQFSLGGAPAPSTTNSAPAVALGSIPSAENEDRSKRRRDGRGYGVDSEPSADEMSAPAFGASSASTTAPTFSFGSTQQTPGALDNGGDRFGSSTPASTFGTTPAASDFGAAATDPFGNASATPAPQFSFGSTPASTPAPPAPTFTFGSSAAPAAAHTPGPPTFGSSAPPTTFGQAPSAPNPFGGAPPTPGFAFGPTPTPAFTPAPTAAHGTPAFSFGGGAPAQPDPFTTAQFGNTQPPVSGGFGQQQPGGFGGGFGSTPHQPPAPGGFGQQQQQQQQQQQLGGFGGGGFGGGGFGGAANPTTPGMGADQAPHFSLGSTGSKTSGIRGRRMIKARRPGSAPRQA
jgi:hypothetical protein